MIQNHQKTFHFIGVQFCKTIDAWCEFIWIYWFYFFLWYFSCFPFRCYYCFIYRQNFVAVLHAVNQYQIDICLKLVVVHGMDHVYVAVFVYHHWIDNLLAFYVSVKSTVEQIMQSKSILTVFPFFFFFWVKSFLII